MPAKRKIQPYAFIDTNIYLDFYRSNNESSLTLLSKLSKVKDRVICTYQVEAEYLKNRQSVMLEYVNQLKLFESSAIPAVIADAALNKSQKKLKDDVKKHVTKIHKKTAKLLDNPKNDKIYNVLEEIFASKSDHVLTRDMPIKDTIKRLAFRRFILGYPPKKSTDNSIGDAINWEWFVNCASSHPGKFMFVSKDNDFGREHRGKPYLNSQLKQEFRDRVGQKSITYTRKLSDALKFLEVSVSKKEEDAEAEALTSSNKVNAILAQRSELLRGVYQIDHEKFQQSQEEARSSLGKLFSAFLLSNIEDDSSSV